MRSRSSNASPGPVAINQGQPKKQMDKRSGRCEGIRFFHEYFVDDEDMTLPRSLVVIVLIEGGKVTVGYLRGKHMEMVRD